jgi:hypothetical protein
MTEDVETRDERRARQAVEGRAAMADYRRKQDAEMEKARRLRALRLAREEMSSLSASTGRDQRATGERLRAKPNSGGTRNTTVDCGRIDLRNPHEMRYWCQRFAVSADFLKAAVKQIGPVADDLARELRKMT